MPTLNFDDGFDKMERIILTKTFRANCDRLGIKDRDCSVALRRGHLGAEMHQGKMTMIEPDQFLIILNANGFNLFEAISTLGHETVHIAQHLRGDMVDAPGAEGITWKDQFFPTEVFTRMYQHLPWEREAFKLQPELHKHALDQLSREDSLHVIKASRDVIEAKAEAWLISEAEAAAEAWMKDTDNLLAKLR